MKKIDLKLSAKQLNTLVYLFNQIGFVYSKERKHRVLKSILDEVILRVKKKHLELESSGKTLFTKAKDTKFTFKYYEADCLEQYLLMAKENPLNEYDRNVALLIITKLNQQLA